jgi:hypothetical protein
MFEGTRLGFSASENKKTELKSIQETKIIITIKKNIMS